MGKIRTWDVNIQELKLQSFEKESLNLFIVVKIGHDYQIVTTKSETGKEILRERGTKGQNFVSELHKNIVKDDYRTFDLSIQTQYRGSYLDIQR